MIRVKHTPCLSPLAMILSMLLLAVTLSPVAHASSPMERVVFAPVQEGFTTTGEDLLPYASGRVLVKFTPTGLGESRLGTRIMRAQRMAPVTGLSSVDALCSGIGAQSISRLYDERKHVALAARLGVDRWFMVEFESPSDPVSVAAEFALDPHVESACPDWRAFPAVIPNDPLHSMHWGHNNTAQMLSYDWATHSHENGTPVGTVGFDAKAEAAWDASQGYGNSGIIIAILDSGVDNDHPDLRQVTGYDYGDNDSDPDDDSSQPGHGTACAGIAAAMADNGLGSAGIAGDCSIMPLKVANSSGDMYFSAIQNALYYAADNGADVASMSLGAAISSDPSTDDALLYAYNAGVILVAATGNENASTISYPAVNQYVMGIGAASPCGERKRSSSSSSEVNSGVNTDPNGYTCDGERWWGSNYGSSTQDAAGAVAVIAPTILPTTDIGGSGGYDASDYSKWFNGTSCATPYVAGICALIKAANSSYTPAQIRQRVVDTAVDVVSVESGTGWDRYSGYGMVDASAAVGGSSTNYASVPYSTDFETGSLDQYWVTNSTGDGRIRILSTNTPHGGSYHLTMDDATSGGFSQNEAWLHLDLSGESQVELGFWWKEFGDETHTQDGVYFSSNGGGSFTKVYDLNGSSYTNNTWNEFTLDVDALASSHGLSMTNTFVVKFQQYDNYPMTSDGFAFDDINVTGGVAKSITVTTPNGGETWTAGDVEYITWSSTGNISNVSLEYSANGGSSWISITGSTTNDGSYGWTVPSAATTAARIRVADASDASLNDISDTNFTIEVPSSTDYASVPYSTGFETGSLDQYWATSSTSDGRIRILSSNTPHSGSYHLTMDDATSGGFSQNEAWLHLDLSGESQVELGFWWKEFGDETHTQDGVYFSSNGGGSFTKVYDLNGSSYTNNTWNEFTLDVDALASSHGLSLTNTFVVKFQQYDNYPMTSDGFAFDDINVTGGVAKSITVTAPNGGETWTAGDVEYITWSSTGSISNVSLDYSTNGGSSWISITSSTTNDGSYGWTVPSAATTAARIRVADASDGSLNDISDANFTIEVPSSTDYAGVPYSTGFETGSLDQYWATSSTGDGRIRILSSNTPHSGSYHLTMDDATSGGFSQNEAWLHLDLSGESQVELGFWWKEFGDETHTQDGVYFSSNGGGSFTKVYDLNGSSYTNNTWNEFTLDVDALASSHGLSLTNTFVVKFQQYDNYPMTTDGFAFDDINVTGGGASSITSETEPNNDSSSSNGPVGSGIPVTGNLSSSSDDDWFYLDVASAGNLNISLDIGSSADLDWFLYDASLTEVARGYSISNPEAGSYNASPGRYYLWVDGYLGATSSYTLTITGGLTPFAAGPQKPMPMEFALHHNWPNPFETKTTLRFDLPQGAEVTLGVYDQQGRQVALLVNGELGAGSYAYVWDGRNAAGQRSSSGVYFCRVEAGPHYATRKLILLK